MYEKIEENLTKAKDLLSKYEKSSSIDERMEIYETLTMYSVFLGENLATLKTQYNRCYYKRKLEISHSFLNNRMEKISERTSLEMANDEMGELIKEELEAEAIANRLDIFLRQLNKVFESMRTRISFEKQEKSRILPNDL